MGLREPSPRGGRPRVVRGAGAALGGPAGDLGDSGPDLGGLDDGDTIVRGTDKLDGAGCGRDDAGPVVHPFDTDPDPVGAGHTERIDSAEWRAFRDLVAGWDADDLARDRADGGRAGRHAMGRSAARDGGPGVLRVGELLHVDETPGGLTRSPDSGRVPLFSLHGLTWLGLVALVAGIYLAAAVLIGLVVTLVAS